MTLGPLPARCEVCIVGGGIVGASVAFFLSQAGIRDVLLLERGRYGDGSTGRAVGGVRHQFSLAANVRLSLRSIAFYRDAQRILGVDVELHQIGYLFLLTNPTDVAEFARAAGLQQSLGVPTVVLEPTQARRLVPDVDLEGVLAATYCPWDGYADPGSALDGLLRGAREEGVRTYSDTPVTAINRDAGGWDLVTPGAVTRAERVVICAGAYSRDVGALAGLDVPVLPYRRQVYVTEPFDRLPRDMPFTIDFGTRFYIRPEPPGFLLGMDDPNEPSGWDTSTTSEFLERLVDAAVARVPVLAEARVHRGWGGLYEVTPDHKPLIGATPLPGLWLCCGFSGHGFMHAPAAGMAMAELLTTGRTRDDLTDFDPGRFARGEVREERYVI